MPFIRTIYPAKLITPSFFRHQFPNFSKIRYDCQYKFYQFFFFFLFFPFFFYTIAHQRYQSQDRGADIDRERKKSEECPFLFGSIRAGFALAMLVAIVRKCVAIKAKQYSHSVFYHRNNPSKANMHGRERRGNGRNEKGGGGGRAIQEERERGREKRKNRIEKKGKKERKGKKNK